MPSTMYTTRMATISSTHRLPSELSNALAAPWKSVVMPVGRVLRGEILHLRDHVAQRRARASG